MADVFPKLTVRKDVKHRCAKMRKRFKALNQVFSFRKVSKTTTFTKSKPCSHVLSCLATFNLQVLVAGILLFEVCVIKNCCFFLLSVGLSSS